ncbi:MAG TPA: phosphate ABC transporter permease subunit PstC [Bacteroidales bacterium]|nr:phosphate ABC transporter permease subunit PstC [Bacteroidales bacterium]
MEEQARQAEQGVEIGQAGQEVSREHSGFVFSRESLKKKFRLSELLSEKLITGVAFLSIAIIILIFFFVFREAVPVFSKKPPEKPVTEQSIQPERYGEQPAPEKIQPERYGVPADTVKAQEMVPERYGVERDSSENVSADTAQYSVDAGEDVVTAKGLLGKTWMPVSNHPRYGLIPLIIGTFKITIISILFAAPIAILAALFSAAFAPRWMREFVKPAIELLAGFPSVVIGFFALMVMATVLQQLFGYPTRLNAFVGGIAMGLAAIPIIFTITEDALTAVPATFKEASLALGASQWQTAYRVTLPAATPGIFAAVLLGIGRVFGETMIALMATGNAALSSANPFESVRTLAATIGAEMAEVVFGDTHYGVLFLIGAGLFIFTFSLNALAEFYVKGKLIKRFQGKIA